MPEYTRRIVSVEVRGPPNFLPLRLAGKAPLPRRQHGVHRPKPQRYQAGEALSVALRPVEPCVLCGLALGFFALHHVILPPHGHGNERDLNPKRTAARFRREPGRFDRCWCGDRQRNFSGSRGDDAGRGFGAAGLSGLDCGRYFFFLWGGDLRPTRRDEATAGGEYVYIRDAYGPLRGVSVGWTWTMVVKPSLASGDFDRHCPNPREFPVSTFSRSSMPDTSCYLGPNRRNGFRDSLFR